MKRKLIVALSLTAGTLSAQIDWGSAKTLYGDKPISPPTDASLLNASYRDSTIDIEKRINDLLPRLTLEEKAEIVHGATLFTIGNIPRIGLGEGLTTDGPQGVHHRGGGKSTAFPNGLAMAATWDEALLDRIGKGLAEETKGTGAVVLLGPGCNIMRTPLNGRNFEYFGEDPYLAGKIAASYIRGVQSGGVGTCLKHWVLNDQEKDRGSIDVDVSERALREIYVRPFEIAIKESNPWSVMNSYNRIRGAHSTHNPAINKLLTDMGYDGAFISDWGAWHDDVKSLNGGCTLAMPSKKDSKRNAKIAELVKNGTIDAKKFDEAVRRDLRFYFRCGIFDSIKPGQANLPETQALALKAAEESMVLLKNNGILPLDPAAFKKIAVIGPNADQYHTTADGKKERGGSGSVNGPYETTPLQGMVKCFGKEKILYAPGFRFEKPLKKSFPDMPELDPETAAKEADIVLFFAGLSHDWDNEGRDKPGFSLQGDQKTLLLKVLAANPKTVVVMISGSPADMEGWHDKAPAILEAWYGGQEAGDAIANVLTGKVNPSGKLPCTFGKKLMDWPSHSLGAISYPGIKPDPKQPPKQFYADHIWVGYRGFDKFNIEPRYPFGFGLSYTSFKIEKLEGIMEQSIGLRITNTGKRAGAEVVQCYVSKPSVDGAPMPVRELAGFKKVYLQPGESMNVSFAFDDETLKCWSEKENKWVVPKGEYRVFIGASSRDLPVEFKFDR